MRASVARCPGFVKQSKDRTEPAIANTHPQGVWGDVPQGLRALSAKLTGMSEREFRVAAPRTSSAGNVGIALLPQSF